MTARPLRLTRIDLLRVGLTAGVIVTHTLITYGGPGSWFLHAGELPPAVRAVVGLPIALGALFGMGAFFFIAGTFVPASVDRRGPVRFLAGRWTRLGWPLIVFVALVVPLVELAVATFAGPPAPAAAVWARQLRLLDAGPLWFVWVLLLFSAVAAGTLRWWPPPTPRPLRPALLIRTAIAIAGLSFVLRIFFRVDSYQVGAAHLWQWGQCLSMFVLGVIAGRQGWLAEIPRRIRRGCLALMLGGMLAVVALIVVFSDDLDPFGGGWHWQSLVLAVIEAVVSVSTAIVLVDLFRGAGDGRFAAALIRAAYGAYLLQTPVLVGLALALRGLPAPDGAKLLIALPLGLALSFTAAALLRRVPGLRRALSGRAL